MDHTRFDRLARALARTRAVLEQAGVIVPKADDIRPWRRSVLIICTGIRFAHIVKMLADRYDVVGAFNDTVAIDFMTARPFDSLIIDEASAPAPCAQIISRIKHHSPLRGIPIFVLRAPQSADLDADLDVHRVAHESDLPTRLAPVTQAWAAARRTRAQMSELRTIRVKAGEYGLDGVSVLQAHVQHALNSKEAPLSLVVFLIKTKSDDHPIKDAPQDAIRSLLSLIHTLTRSQDLIFDLENGLFALLLAGANATDARSVTDRLCAIMRNSMTFDPQTSTINTPVIFSGVVGFDGFEHLQDMLDHASKRIGEDMFAQGY